MEWNTELMQQAKTAADADALLALAKANGVELTPAQAKKYYDQLNPKMGELEDDDLDAVAGGLGGCNGSKMPTVATASCTRWTCRTCGGTIGQAEVFGSLSRDVCSGCGATNLTCGTCKYVSGDGIILHCTRP